MTELIGMQEELPPMYLYPYFVGDEESDDYQRVNIPIYNNLVGLNSFVSNG